MSTVRKLEQAEVATILERSGKLDLAPYAAALAELSIGDWGLIELEATDRLPVVKRRYTMAARGQGKRLIYKRLRQSSLPFEVREYTVPAAAPAKPSTRSVQPASPATKRATRSVASSAAPTRRSRKSAS